MVTTTKVEITKGNVIPARRKQTAAGVIPETWEITRLGDIATIATGNTPPTQDLTNYGDEYPFVSPVDIGEAKYVANTEKRLSKKGFTISRRFPAGSILFVSIGSTIGKCGIAPIELTSNQQINAIFPSPSFSVDYLYYIICAAAPRIRGIAGEQAVPIVNKAQFSGTMVPLAPFCEQHVIAEALSDVDGLLGALGDADRQEAGYQTSCHAATPHRQDPPAALQRGMGDKGRLEISQMLIPRISGVIRIQTTYSTTFRLNK